VYDLKAKKAILFTYFSVIWRQLMENIFMKTPEHSHFSWSSLGNIKEGRGDLGEEMPVLVYRLMQFTMLDVLAKDFGKEKANNYFRSAGYLAGTEFAGNALDLKVDFNTFIANLQNALQELKIGILRMESFDEETGAIMLTVGQDLDCSGLPITNENVCAYDEGFIAGILERYTNKTYTVREVDCWASGDRVCRFHGTVAR
jgi:predicted hydrocarbon binding protein